MSFAATSVTTATRSPTRAFTLTSLAPPTSTSMPRSGPSGRSRPCSDSPASSRSSSCVCYFAFPVGKDPKIIAGYGASNVTLGVTLGLALLCIGIGAIQWARKLMSDVEIVEMRHSAASSDADREESVAAFNQGVSDSGIARRPLIRNSLLGALATARPAPDRGAARPRPAARRQARPHRVAQGHAARQRRRRHTHQARGHGDRPAGQRRAGRLLRGEGRRAPLRGHPARAGQGQGGHRDRPDEAGGHHAAARPEELGRRRDPLLLEDLHPRGLPDLAVGAADPQPALPLPPVDLRPGRQR